MRYRGCALSLDDRRDGGGRLNFYLGVSISISRRRGSMDRSASAKWQGSLKEGKGTISTQSGTLREAQYSFGTRFENGVGTNPEELIAAAHAGCFTMALSAQLTGVELPPESLETTAVVTLETTGDGPTVTKIHPTTRAKV